MDKILHDLKDPKLWELWYIPYYGSCRILSINRNKKIVNNSNSSNSNFNDLIFVVMTSVSVSITVVIIRIIFMFVLLWLCLLHASVVQG